MKEIEQLLLMAQGKGLSPWDTIETIPGLHYKVGWRILEKWCRKGWVDYGTSIRSCWMTNEGIKKQEEIRLQRNPTETGK